jgi:hypothetical protein
MITVKLIQFLRPDGRENPVETDLPDCANDDYQDMLAAGCRFEAEMLMTDEVSVTISDDGSDIDISLTPNGPEVQRGMVAMLSRRLWRSVPQEA